MVVSFPDLETDGQSIPFQILKHNFFSCLQTEKVDIIKMINDLIFQSNKL